MLWCWDHPCHLPTFGYLGAGSFVMYRQFCEVPQAAVANQAALARLTSQHNTTSLAGEKPVDFGPLLGLSVTLGM